MSEHPKHPVEIPEFYLLTLAVHGNMGNGELPKIIQVWAQNECRRLGLDGKVKTLQIEKIQQIEANLRNVIGDQGVNQIKSAVAVAIQKLKS